MIGVANPTSSLEARWTPTRTPSPPHRTSPSTTPCGTPPTALLAASRGSTPKLTNAELVCLAVMQALLGYASEARWLRHARAHLRGLFPYLPGQAGYNKRLRAAFPLPRYFIRALASDSDLWADPVWVADSTPVEYGRSRVTVRRSALAGWAAYGYCRSHTRWFWGLRLHLVCTLSCTACRSRSRWPTPKPTSEPCWSTCWSTCWRSSRGWQQRGRGWSSWPTRATATPNRTGLDRPGVRLLRPAFKREAPRRGQALLKPLRQLIESVNATLKGQLDPERHGRRTIEGVTRGRQRAGAAAPAGPDRRDLAQPQGRPADPAVPDRLRLLTPWNQSSSGSGVPGGSLVGWRRRFCCLGVEIPGCA